MKSTAWLISKVGIILAKINKLKVAKGVKSIFDVANILISQVA